MMKGVDQEFYNKCIEYISGPELVVKITELKEDGYVGIGDDRYTIKNTKYPFKIGMRVVIKPLSKSDADDQIEYFYVLGRRRPTSRHKTNTWGSTGRVVGISPNGIEFNISDNGFVYHCHKDQYAPDEDEEAPISDLKLGDWIVYHRLTTALESGPATSLSGRHENVRWYPAADEQEGFVDFCRYIMTEGALRADDHNPFVSFQEAMDMISTDESNLWRQCVRRLFDHEYETDALEKFICSC